MVVDWAISIHALHGEGDWITVCASATFCISIHALHGEGDAGAASAPDISEEFQSTPSTGRATWYTSAREITPSISIHALHGEGDVTMIKIRLKQIIISIHALHGEGDGIMILLQKIKPMISIHALHGEGDLYYCARSSSITNFNPRPPRGGRRRIREAARS